ncbi:MAG: hypothetical protein QW803_12145 [Candidatus Methanomethylicia archaeon]
MNELIKDFRNDIKKLIETLITLNNNLAKLESFTVSIEKLTKELEEINKNFKLLMEMNK